MFKLLKQVFKTGDATLKYPFAPYEVEPGFRGKPEFSAQDCISCAACTIACPPNALTMHTDPQKGKRTWRLNYGRCIFCARCEEVCPTGAIGLSSDFEMAVFSKADLMVTAEFSLTNCRVCDQPFAPTKEINYVIELLVQAGLPESQLEIQRRVVETCPQCKRRADAAKMRSTHHRHLQETRR